MGLLDIFGGRNVRKYKVALNCHMAKATFAQANDDLRSAAVFRSWRVLEKMGFSEPTEMRCPRYCFRRNGHSTSF